MGEWRYRLISNCLAGWSGAHCVGDSVDPKINLDSLDTSDICPCRNLNPDSSVTQSVVLMQFPIRNDGAETKFLTCCYWITYLFHSQLFISMYIITFGWLMFSNICCVDGQFSKSHATQTTGGKNQRIHNALAMHIQWLRTGLQFPARPTYLLFLATKYTLGPTHTPLKAEKNFHSLMALYLTKHTL
jgi:hypothetical protein